ncbi:methyltransferase domain-containing protein [Flavisolibacter sp. BT320]|nr:methyltransferase domain-containing protein [Flavisolibacter longurius]
MQIPITWQTVTLQHETISLYVPDAGAVKTAYAEGKITSPYWSQVWPAAKALAQFILTNPSLLSSKSVLELGAGLGLPSLVAARFAASVQCTDVAKEAVEIVQASAERLQLKNVYSSVLDWQQLPSDLRPDVLLLSDINYEPAAFVHLQAVVKAFLEEGTNVILSTPQRLVAKEFVLPLLQHCTYQEEQFVEHNGGQVPTAVLVLK